MSKGEEWKRRIEKWIELDGKTEMSGMEGIEEKVGLTVEKGGYK